MTSATTYEDNIRQVLAAATPEQVAAGKRWYQTAHTFAVGLAKRYNLTLEQTAGIIAALSPRMPWERNMACADELCRTGTTTGALPLSLERALLILYDTPPEKVLAGPKVTAFYANILNPQTDRPVIDQHAISVAYGERLARTPPEVRRAGGLERIVAAFQAVAASVGLSVSAVQAITWYVWR
jgi:hypothetical protein